MVLSQSYHIGIHDFTVVIIRKTEGCPDRYRVLIKSSLQPSAIRRVDQWHDIVEYETNNASVVGVAREALDCLDIQPYLWA